MKNLSAGFIGGIIGTVLSFVWFGLGMIAGYDLGKESNRRTKYNYGEKHWKER